MDCYGVQSSSNKMKVVCSQDLEVLSFRLYTLYMGALALTHYNHACVEVRGQLEGAESLSPCEVPGE